MKLTTADHNNNEAAAHANVKVVSSKFKSLMVVPPEIFQYVNLRVLELSWNNISVVPKEIGQLVSLTEVRLDHNQIQDFPGEFALLKNLEILSIDYNEIDCVPDCILELSSLQELSLEGNSRIRELPAKLNAKLPNLAWLILEGTAITTSTIPTDILKNDTLAILLDSRDHHKIMDNLFIGGQEHLNNKALLNGLDVRHIFALNNTTPSFPGEFEYHMFDVQDSTEQRILHFFDNSNQTLSSILRGKQGNVLIACAASMSRSASFVIAYVMYSMNMSYRDAFYFVRKLHPLALPNPSFREQLYQYEQALANKGSNNIIS